MTTINLTGQDLDLETIMPKLAKMKQMMVDRRPVWDKLTYAQRKKWVKSGKDDVMQIAYQIYQFLCDFFDGEEKEYEVSSSSSSSSSST